ncbi:MAG: thiamine-phosphate kinase [Candidatus Binatia bacterium]
MKLRDLGEFSFLRRLRARVPHDERVQIGIGDDCAALSLPGTTLLTTDTMIENVHFRRAWTTFALLGAKAFAVNASDIAAMGGEPTFALLSVSVPRDMEVEDLDAFFSGFLAAAESCGAALIGGNMSAAPCLMITVTLLGTAQQGIITRSGARVGDDVYVTGFLGDGALGLRVLQDGSANKYPEDVKTRFLCPTVRLAVSRILVSQQIVSAMIDISDGLLQDLGHVCEASHVGAVIEAAALPLSPHYQAIVGKQEWQDALTGGEDYELLFTATSAHRAAIAQVARESGCLISRIGKIGPAAAGISVRGPDGAEYSPARSGFDHFRQA